MQVTTSVHKWFITCKRDLDLMKTTTTISLFSYNYRQKKKKGKEKIAPPPTSNNFRPMFAMKIMGEPHGETCKLNFHWKMWSIFFSRPPLQGSKLLRGFFFLSFFLFFFFFFLHKALTSVWTLWTVVPKFLQHLLSQWSAVIKSCMCVCWNYYSAASQWIKKSGQ